MGTHLPCYCPATPLLALLALLATTTTSFWPTAQRSSGCACAWSLQVRENRSVACLVPPSLPSSVDISQFLPPASSTPTTSSLSHPTSRTTLHGRYCTQAHRWSPPTHLRYRNQAQDPHIGPAKQRTHRQALNTFSLAAVTRQLSFGQNETPPDHLSRRASRLCSGWQALGHWHRRPHGWFSSHEHRVDDRRRAYLHHLLPGMSSFPRNVCSTAPD